VAGARPDDGTNARWNAMNTTSMGNTTRVIPANTTTAGPPPCPADNETSPIGSVMFSGLVRKISGPK
jgi:hypothetical protein